MHATIRIPSPLRRFTDNQPQLDVEAQRVRDALERLCERYPQLRAQLLDEAGALRNFVNIYLNQEDIRQQKGLETALTEDCILRIVPAIAGGSGVLPDLSPAELGRYSRHIMLPELGREGQQKLKASRVLVIGAGGLGSPLGLYLTAAGVGTLGIVDHDEVEESNLQRQILFGLADIGQSKAERAAARLRDLNPHIELVTYRTALKAHNALDIIRDYDLVIDGTDNFPTRYLVNDACVLLGKPNIYGSIFRFEGQATVFNFEGGPCYRCLYPEPPPPGMVPSCAEGGVLGVLPALIGSIQATEAVKVLTGIGTSLKGRLLLYDALHMQFDELQIHRDTDCRLCGEHPTVTELVDYEAFCGIPPTQDAPSHDEITARELKTRLEGGNPPLLLDVREPWEVEICRIPGALTLPMQEIGAHLDELPRDAEIVVHCKSGGRSAKVCDQLRHAGFRQPLNLRGGILAWIDEVDPGQTRY